MVYDRLIKNGHAVCRCGLALEQERSRRSIEIPTWMFEPLACSRLRVVPMPMVGCDALLELKTLLQAAHRPDRGDVYKRSIVPCSPQEVLMPRSVNRRRRSQLTLLQPPTSRPSFQTFPPEIRERTIRLLARLLRVHVGRRVGAAEARGARDE